MKVVSTRKIDMTEHGVTTKCEVFVAYIIIEDIEKRAEEMIESISDTSWINKLESVAQAAFKATSARSIEKLVKNILNRTVDDDLTEDFGEYLVSDTAQCALNKAFDHTTIPLAELIKARVSGNEGFDFHTECKDSLITFGEAKYSGSTTPYTKALSQIASFIELEKDLAELVVLSYHISKEAAEKCVNGDKSFAAAFSINAAKPDLIFKNALESKHLAQLLGHNKLYLIGVKVNDSKLD